MTDQGSILIVDDEPAIATMLYDHLIADGYRVDVALHAGDALMLASLERPDAVILDLMLPEIGGEQVFGQLRERDPSIAIVVLTGMGDESVARGLLRAGAFDYLRKPPDFPRLRAAIALAVAAGRARSLPGTVVPFTSDRRTPPPPSPTSRPSGVTDLRRRPYHL